jgi:hypothetical protein
MSLLQCISSLLTKQAGDEEHNPFAQWEDIGLSQEKELHAKVAKRQTARQAQRVSRTLSLRRVTDAGTERRQ